MPHGIGVQYSYEPNSNRLTGQVYTALTAVVPFDRLIAAHFVNDCRWEGLDRFAWCPLLIELGMKRVDHGSSVKTALYYGSPTFRRLSSDLRIAFTLGSVSSSRLLSNHENSCQNLL
jgi:hypothetical protein